MSDAAFQALAEPRRRAILRLVRDLPPAERPRHASGWTHYLARLQTAAPGRDPGPDPGMPDGCPAGTRWSR